MSKHDLLNRMARSALLVGGTSIVTLVLTLGYQLLIARTFGASGQLDAFWMALAIPRAIVESFHFGLLTLLFVLVFHRRTQGQESDPWYQSSAVLNVTVLSTVAMIALLVVFSTPMMRWMAPGFSPANTELAASLLRRLALMLIPTVIAAALGGLAVARGNLAPFTLSRAAMPALQILALVALASRIGVWALVWAAWLGAAAAVAMYVPWARQVGLKHRFTFGLRHPETREILKLQGVLAVAWIVINCNQIAGRYFATLLGPGSVSALEYAWRFEVPIAQIVSLAVALPTFALLAQSASANRRDDFRAALATSARLLVLAVLPMLAFMVAFREPLTSLWLQRGVFTEDAVHRVASLLPALAIVYFCRAFASVLVFGLLITGRAWLLLGGLTVEVVLNVLLSMSLSRTMGLSGVVLASAISMLIVNGALWTALLRDIGAFAPIRMVAHLRPHAVSVLVALAIVEVVRRSVDLFGPEVTGARALLPIGILGAAYLLVYVVVCATTGLIDFQIARGLPRVALRSLE
jgi:putative peptidoglycan lipid II flippase